MKSLLKWQVSILLLTLVLQSGNALGRSPIKHVLVVSIDGLHAIDLRRYIEDHPQSAEARLATDGIEYTNAHSVVPADSFPGVIGMFTGGGPGVTGVYYDVGYDRQLAASVDACRNGLLGSRVAYNESVDADKGKAPPIDPARLPLRPSKCTPVYPHEYLRTNTAFEVVRAMGGYTAWIDKHPVYEVLNGPSGHGVDDLYTPEIGGDFEAVAKPASSGITGSIASTEAYDTLKVHALLSEIDGWRHDHSERAPVPALFGLNLQAVNVAQKLDGYRDADGDPSRGLADALDHCDRLLGTIVAELRRQHVYESTLLVLTAKHGNAPIAPSNVVHVDKAALRRTIDSVAPGSLVQLTADQGALIWLRRRSDAPVVARALRQAGTQLGIRDVLTGERLDLRLSATSSDPRAPDIVVMARTGVIYGKPGEGKRAEHGGFDDDDTHVALLVVNPALKGRGDRVAAPVVTTQLAPTILDVLGIPPEKLDAVKKAHTAELPAEIWRTLDNAVN